MAKKDFSSDFLGNLGEDPSSGARRRGKKGDFGDPTRDIGRGAVKRASGKKDWVQAGQYARKTITLLPEQVKYVKEMADREGIGILALYRWLVDQGLQAYERGERPAPEREVVQDVQLGHWTGRRD